MSKRIIEIVLPEGKANDLTELLYERELDGFWQTPLSSNKANVRILLSNGEVEAVLESAPPHGRKSIKPVKPEKRRC